MSKPVTAWEYKERLYKSEKECIKAELSDLLIQTSFSMAGLIQTVREDINYRKVLKLITRLEELN